MLIVFHVYIIIHATYTMAIKLHIVTKKKQNRFGAYYIVHAQIFQKELEFTTIATTNITLFIYQFATKTFLRIQKKMLFSVLTIILILKCA